MTSVRKKSLGLTTGTKPSGSHRPTLPNTSGSKPTHTNPFIPDGVTPGFNDYRPDEQNSGKWTAFDDLLAMFQGQSDFAQFLATLGLDQGKQSRLGPDETADWNKQLVDTLLQYMTTSENRIYNEGLRDEQRIYDSPTNQLARLMGAGISRDAAIQMLGSAGSGASSAAPYSDAVQADMGIPTSQTAANGAAASSAIGGLALNTLQLCMNMVSMGFSVPQAIEQTKAIQMQNYTSGEQQQAYKSAKQVTQAAQNLFNSGALNRDEIANLTDLEGYLNNNKDNPAISSLFTSGAFNGAFGTPYGREFLNHFWDNMLKSQSSGNALTTFMRHEELTNAVLAMDAGRIGAEMEKLGAEKRLADQQVIESCNRVAVGEAQIQVLGKQGHWLDVQAKQLVRKTDAEVNALDTQTYGQNYDNELKRLNYEYNEYGFPMMKESRLRELKYTLAHWQTITNPDELRKQQQTWLMDIDNAYDAAYLKSIHDNAVGSFAAQYPLLYQVSCGFQASGAGDMVRTGVEAGATVGAGVKAAWNLVPGTPKVP